MSPRLAAVRVSNAAVPHSTTSPPVAVFVGGTSGIGQAMAETFAKQTNGSSHILLVGRNRTAAERVLASLPKPASGEYAREFVQCDATLMKNVQSATQDILTRFPKINYLILSPGYMTLQGRDETTEGIDKKLAVHYYARWKFTHDLLPALTKAKDAGEEGAVMSVLGSGLGGPIDLNDLGLKKSYSLSSAAGASITYTDLMFESFASKAPSITFIHAAPGLVRTSLLTSSPSSFLRASSFLLNAISAPFAVSGEECSQYMWHTIYKTATEPGAYRTDNYGENIGKKNYYGDDEQRNKVWEHTEAVMRDALKSEPSDPTS